MTRYIAFFISLIVLLTSVQISFAQDTQNEQFDLSIDLSTYTVTITGRLINRASGQRVTLRVLDDNEDIVHFSQFNAAHGGNYKYSFEINSGGNFTLYLKSDINPGAAPLEYDGDDGNGVSVISPATLGTYMSEINGAATYSEMEQKISQYRTDMWLLDPAIARVSETDYFINAVADVFAEKQSKPGRELAFGELSSSLKVNCAIQMLNVASGEAGISQALTDFAETYELDELSVYSRYTGMNGVSKAKVWRAMANTDKVYQKNNYKDIFAEQLFTISLNESFSGQVMGILTDFNRYLNLSPSLTVLNFDQKNSIANALAGKSYDFPQTNTAYASAANTGGGGTGGGGGGGGGGGAAGNTVSNIIVDSEMQNIEQLVKPPLFTDLEEASWAKDYILSLVEMKVIDGYEDRTVRPNNLIVREEYLKMLMTAFDMLDEEASATFKDMSEEDWFYQYVATAQKYAIVRGISDEEFGVGLNISRQDMCTMAYRIAVRTGVKIQSQDYGEKFADDYLISDYAREIVYTLKNIGIINGMGENRFNPLGTATRAEAAKIILELINFNTVDTSSEGENE